jgi:hypothetical protein
MAHNFLTVALTFLAGELEYGREIGGSCMQHEHLRGARVCNRQRWHRPSWCWAGSKKDETPPSLHFDLVLDRNHMATSRDYGV